MAAVKTPENNMLVRMWRNWKPCTLLMGMPNGVANIESSLVVLTKLKIELSHQSAVFTSEYISKKKQDLKSICILTCIVALFKIDEWKIIQS